MAIARNVVNDSNNYHRWFKKCMGIILPKEGVSMPIVKCNVANCVYWEQGNNCSADSILVEVDGHANKEYEITSSGELVGSADHQDESPSVASTCCHTFRSSH